MKSRAIILAAAIAAIAPAFAGSYYLRSAEADWSDPQSFATDSAMTVVATDTPDADDDVFLPANATVSIADGTASFSTASAVRRIVPRSGSRLILTVDGNANFSAMINNGATLATTKPDGEVVKLGDGVLTLTATSTVPGNVNLDFSYYSSYVVGSGTLKFPQRGCALHYYYGDVTVSNGATLYMPVSFNISTGASKESYMRMRSLCGDGSVTVDSSLGNNYNKAVYLEEWDSSRKVSVFGGLISGANVGLYVQSSLTMTNSVASSNTGRLRVQHDYDNLGTGGNGVISLAAFGGKQGVNNYLEVGEYGGGFRYIGSTGETTDKDFKIGDNVSTKIGDSFLDAGPHGGVTFTGKFYNNSESVKNLHLIGSNTVPCVLANAWSASSTASYPIFVTKGGSGTWKLDPSSASGPRGGLAVEDGTLQFASISNIGERCALGTAEFLTRPMTGVPAEDDMRTYAHAIGSTDPDANAVFEYVGGECAIVTNRPTVMVGSGTIRSSATGTGYLALTDVSPRDGDAATLVIDGTNANHNLARDVYDGSGVASVVKRGSGEWALSGNTPFSGSLRVEEGILTVLGPRYTWFRLSVMQAGEGAAENTGSTRGQIVLAQLALYDADGRRQNVGLSYDPAYTSGDQPADAAWQKLTPGSVKVGRAGIRTYAGANDLDCLFTDNTATGATIRYKTDNGSDYVIQSTNDPSTWISYVMRLTNGVPEIAAYDIRAYNLASTVGKRWPKYVRMEGSRDGVRWDWLGDHEFDFSLCGGNYNCWLSDGSTFTVGQIRKGKGVAIRGAATDAFVLSNVTAVAVSPGAVLRTFDDVTLPALEVDCNGCGTIQGFAFAESGALDVKNIPVGSVFELPVSFVDVKNVSNLANWSVSFNGTPKATAKVKVDGNRVFVVRPGLSISIR